MTDMLTGAAKIEALAAGLPHRYRILIVDDIESNRFTLDMMLSVLGDFELDEAEDGFDALEKINAKAYDLVLLDIMMPGMTGLELLDKLSPNTKENGPAIIMVSALEELETTVKALESGALDYLTKPIEQPLLVARLAQLLERKVTSLQLQKQQDRIQSDLKKAADIQLSICPSQLLQISAGPDTPQIDVFGAMQTSLEVGGDFFDYFTLPDDKLFFVVGDACDKGAPAAMYATRTRDMLRLASTNRFGDLQRSDAGYLEQVVTDVNQILSENNEDCWFVTVWAGLFDPKTAQLTWCSSGHCPALLRDGSGVLSELDAIPSSPVGLDADAKITAATRTLNPGECVIVYSDGILEGRRPDGSEIGMQGFQALLDQYASADIRTTITDTVSALVQAAGDADLHDDITLVGVSYAS